MVAGSLVDLIGPRRVWLLGLALFCAATFLPLAPSVFWMDVLRLVQGTGGAAASPPPCPRWRRCSTARRAPAPSACWAPPSASACPSVRWPPAGWSRRRDGNGCSGHRPVGLLGAAMVAAGVRATPAGMRPARLARRALLHRRAGPVHLRHAAGARNRLAQSRRTGLAAGICRAGRGLRARRAPHRQPAAGAGPVPQRPLSACRRWPPRPPFFSSR